MTIRWLPEFQNCQSPVQLLFCKETVLQAHEDGQSDLVKEEPPFLEEAGQEDYRQVYGHDASVQANDPIVQIDLVRDEAKTIDKMVIELLELPRDQSLKDTDMQDEPRHIWWLVN